MDFDVDAVVDSIDFDAESWLDDLNASSIFSGGDLSNADLSDSIGLDDFDFNSAIGLKSEGMFAGGQASNDGIAKSFSAPTGLLSTAQGWIKENPKLAEFLLKSAGGAWAAGKAGENALAGTKLQEEIANRKRERIQQSIMGMAEMPRGNASPLTRMNGSRVYNEKGGLA